MAFGPLEMMQRQYVLAECVRANHWSRGAELGLESGQTIGYLLSAFPLLLMIGVDVFRHMPEAPGEESYRDMDHKGNREKVMEIANLHPERFRLIVDTTAAASSLVQDASQDFIFIDADHSYEGAKQDIELWLSKVRRGGWIMGHDYPMAGVNRAVQEKFGSSFVLLPARIWAVEKK